MMKQMVFNLFRIFRIKCIVAKSEKDVAPIEDRVALLGRLKTRFGIPTSNWWVAPLWKTERQSNVQMEICPCTDGEQAIKHERNGEISCELVMKSRGVTSHHPWYRYLHLARLLDR